MSKIVLYIAISLDGYIAKPDGNLDWLTTFPAPSTGDYGYAELLDSIEATIMGRKTYQEIIGFGMEWPYSSFNSYVLTSNNDLTILSPNTYIITENYLKQIEAIKKNAIKDIWLIGGGLLVSESLNNGLIDKMTITILPKLIGQGVRLFPNTTPEMDWKLVSTTSFDTRAINLVYEKIEHV